MKLLIIEDDTTLSQTLAASLSYHGHEVRTARRMALAGLQAAADWTPDLVILDVMMPGMDGWEVCRRLREDNGHPGDHAHRPGHAG